MKIIEHFPNLIQTLHYDCGATALLSIFVHFGEYTDVKDLKRESQTRKSGTTPERLVEVCLKHGIKANFSENMTISDLEKNIDKDLPVLISIQIKRKPFKDIENIWSKGHFVVVIGYDDENFYFADPKFPFITFLKRQELDERWHDSDNYPNMIKIRRRHYGIIFDPPNNWKVNNGPKHLIETLDTMMKKYKLTFKK